MHAEVAFISFGRYTEEKHGSGWELVSGGASLLGSYSSRDHFSKRDNVDWQALVAVKGAHRD